MITTDANHATLTAEQAARFNRNGFSKPFGEFTVRATEICVVISVRRFRAFGNPTYGVYMRHGTPGGAFWRNEEPIRDCETLAEAKDLAERLYGITGSGELATIVQDRL